MPPLMLFKIIPVIMRLQRRRKFRIVLVFARIRLLQRRARSIFVIEHFEHSPRQHQTNSGPRDGHEHNRYSFDWRHQSADHPRTDKGAKNGDKVLAALTFQPTEPSSEIATNACASMANSIGSACSTSLANPLTISATASSSSMPRDRQ